MSMWDNFIERHLQVSSKAGPEYTVFCVFHEDGGKASMYVNTRKRVFYCHACGARGKINKLRDMFGSGLISNDMAIADIRERLRAINVHAPEESKTYDDEWLYQFQNPTDYWTLERGLSESVVQKFELGYDPFTHAGTIPLRDSHGGLLGVIRRHFGDYQPRYLYPKGFVLSRFLYGADKVRKFKGDEPVVLVEGSLDCIALWDVGIPAMAILGSQMSVWQARFIHDLGIKSVVLFYDRDDAGRKATQQTMDSLTGVVVKVVDYNLFAKGDDPASIAPGKRAKAVAKAVPAHRFRVPS